MTQVIIYENENGNVSLCIPTGELTIEEVKEKDTPSHSIIVDDSILPQGDDAKFFDAWVLNEDNTISIDIPKSQTIATNNLNAQAKIEAQHRITNTSIGIENELSDYEWLNLLNTARSSISTAKTTTEILASMKPVQDAIANNLNK